MLDYYTRLEERVGELGNHHRKYLRNISTIIDPLIDRLETCGVIDQVHLWSTSPDLAREMDIILDAGRDDDEKVAFLGCYFAIQFLQMNISAVDVLTLNLATSEERYDVYKDFMRQIGNEFRSLTACHMQRLLHIFLGDNEPSRYVICGVGTRADQDDIDVGILDDGSAQRGDLNLALGRLQRGMLKQAVPLHFYLSEHVGSQSYSASIPEYRDLLKREIHDFVIITEMLGAAPIIGSEHLFRQFRHQVTQRYYYSRSGDNHFHEGYLRGLLGEVRSLLIRNAKRNSINPKDDALRMLKGIIFAGKTVFNIRKVNAWDILKKMEERDPEHREIYDILDRSLTFLEVFRFLYQLFVVQEEEIYLGGEDTMVNLQAVAKTMGYQDVGVVKAWDHLLIHYYEHVNMVKEPIQVLLTDVSRHLENISTFSGLLKQGVCQDASQGNLAVDFIQSSRFFRGTKYWDDVLGAFEADDGILLACFVADFNSLDQEQREKMISRYADWSHFSFMFLMRILVLLHRNRKHLETEQLFSELNDASLDVLSRCRNVIYRMATIFHNYPRLVNTYLLSITESDQLRIMKLLEGKVWEPELAALRDQLMGLCELHCCSNRYFKRFFLSIIDSFPEYLKYINNTGKLKELAKGLFGKIDNLKTFREKREQLGHYHDIEFFRVGLETLGGGPSERTNAEFTLFSDNYTQTLFDVCKQAVEKERGEKLNTKDLFGVFAAGGHAREQAFDDDYDIILLLNSPDEALRWNCSAIIRKMNTELVKRGILPHYWFGSKFGHYITLFDEIEEFFEHDDDDTFIDKSQILGARLVVGSRRFEKSFRESIIKPHIFDKSAEYIAQMDREIHERHAGEIEEKGNGIDIKESRGGLRDIEMVMLMIKAAYRLWTPVSLRLFDEVSQVLPEKEETFRELAEIFSFLKRLRDLYRLTVAADDIITAENLQRVSTVMNLSSPQPHNSAEQLMRLLNENLKRSGDIVSGMRRDLVASK